VLPLWVRAGAVLPKIPEDVMTLVPEKESGNTTVKSLDDRRVYEVIAGNEPGETKITDFEGRAVTRSGNSLKISGAAARVIVRWRFSNITNATVNGSAVTVQAGANGPYAEFDHTAESVVAWTEGPRPAVIPPAVVAPTIGLPATGLPTTVSPAAAPVRSGTVGARVVPGAAAAKATTPGVHRSATHRSSRAAARRKARAKAKAAATTQPK
jgi:hypothetical protein